MKRYRIHFIYLLIIGVLAVLSRIKTNELEEQVRLAEKQSSQTRDMAMKAQEEAHKLYEECKK